MSDSRTMDEYAVFLDETSWYAHAHEGNAKEFTYLTMGLSGESGEFTDALKKIIREIGFDDESAFQYALRDPEVRDTLIHELGDTLWYLQRLASLLGLDVPQLAIFNTYKLYERLEELGKIDTEKTPWPFSDPWATRPNIKNAMLLMEASNVRLDKKVRS